MDSIITDKRRAETTPTAATSAMRLSIVDIQETLKNHNSWIEGVHNSPSAVPTRPAAWTQVHHTNLSSEAQPSRAPISTNMFQKQASLT